MTPRIALFIFIAILAGDALAAVQSLQAIDKTVREYVAATMPMDEDVEIAVGRLDPRLRLPACEQPLGARFTHDRRNSGANAVEVRCEGTKPWSLYVSVNLARYAEIVVATRPIARGVVIDASDLKLERRKLSAAHQDYLTEPDRVTGQIALRIIPAGQALQSHLLERPQLVRRGQRVVLFSGNRAISVRMSGKALEDGAEGDWISVRNLNSNRIVEGVVSARGMVVVNTGGAIQFAPQQTARAGN